MVRILSSIYSLRKSKQVLRHTFRLFQKKKKNLNSETRALIQEQLIALQSAIMEGDREGADRLAKQTLNICSAHLKKNSWDQMREFVIAIVFALSIATIVRQMWFEPYEIPTGSMRPTFREQDRLIVSKTNFGINIPLRPAHAYFEPECVKRSGVIVFTGENMDIRDVDTMYFYIFPGKKQYIKRMIGKPGDKLYFYGGKIYGIDREGRDISHELQLAMLDRIEHIPFLDFDRKMVLPPSPVNNLFSPVYIYQMNEPVAMLSTNKTGIVTGEVIGNTGVKDYFDLWGIKNYGMTRLLTREEVKQHTDQDPSQIGEGVLYLEITHHPSIAHPRLYRDDLGRLRPALTHATSILPLQQEHLQALFDTMYTARFHVKGGIAYRHGIDAKAGLKNSFSPRLPHVPDGCYEFYYGKAYRVKWQGLLEELPSSHPLYNHTPELVQLLYNVGIEWDMRFMPKWNSYHLAPSRYAYFRDGDLYLLGSPVFKQKDAILQQFIQSEKNKLHPFADAGAPLKADGSLDTALIQQYGISIPEKSYLVLGDNHAMSADSRDFGFVPESNLRGAPDFIFWPPGSRWGFPNQPAYPWMPLSRLIVWVMASCAIGTSVYFWRKRNKLPLDLKS